MRIRTAKELGLLIRDARRKAGLTQAGVADKMHATQKWVSGVEQGKDTAEIGRVFRLMDLLRLDINVAESEIKGGRATDDIIDSILDELER